MNIQEALHEALTMTTFDDGSFVDFCISDSRPPKVSGDLGKRVDVANAGRDDYPEKWCC